MIRPSWAPGDSVSEAFRVLVSGRPEAALVVSRDHRTSRAQVWELADSLAAVLGSTDLASGEVVGLAMANGPVFLSALLAIRRIGCAVLMLDVSSPPAERLRIARCLGARGIVTCESAWSRDGGEARYESCGLTRRHLARVDSEIAVVKLTSGSTGCPRGVVTPERALIADDAALASTMGLEADERIVASVPMSFSYGLSSIAMPALMRGSVVVVPHESTPLGAFLAARELRATFFPTVPSYLGALTKLKETPVLPSSMRLVVSAGAPLSSRVATWFRQRFGLPVHAFYGASECGGICYDRGGGAAERGSVGTPVDGVCVDLQGEGGCGVVVVRSPAVSCGYLPSADPQLAGGRFVTSDRGSWVDGELVLRGRLDDQINVKGMKVDPQEVESVLSQVDGVEEVVVLGVPRRDGHGQVVRAVLTGDPASLNSEHLRMWCRGRLARHKIPSSFAVVDAIPRTSRGKIDREFLVDLHTEGAAQRTHVP